MQVWDKASRPGGRFTSHRRPGGGGQVDLGGQYITATGRYRQLHAPHYNALLEAGLLRPLKGRAPVQEEEREEIGARVAVRGAVGGGVHPVALDHQCFQQDDDSSGPVGLSMTDNYTAPRGVEAIVAHYWSEAGVEVEAHRPLTGLHYRGDHWLAESHGKQEK